MNARFYTQKTETVGIVVHVPSVPPGLDDMPILSGDILLSIWLDADVPRASLCEPAHGRWWGEDGSPSPESAHCSWS